MLHLLRKTVVLLQGAKLVQSWIFFSLQDHSQRFSGLNCTRIIARCKFGLLQFVCFCVGNIMTPSEVCYPLSNSLQMEVMRIFFPPCFKVNTGWTVILCHMSRCWIYLAILLVLPHHILAQVLVKHVQLQIRHQVPSPRHQMQNIRW